MTVCVRERESVGHGGLLTCSLSTLEVEEEGQEFRIILGLSTSLSGLHEALSYRLPGGKVIGKVYIIT